MKKVVIVISGGAVQSVQKPKGVALEIRDYDIENDGDAEDRGDCVKDKDGDWYQRMFWGEDQAEE